MTIIIGTVIVFFSIIVILYPVFARRDSKSVKLHNPINPKPEGSPFQNEINFITQELEEEDEDPMTKNINEYVERFKSKYDVQTVVFRIKFKGTR